MSIVLTRRQNISPCHFDVTFHVMNVWVNFDSNKALWFGWKCLILCNSFQEYFFWSFQRQIKRLSTEACDGVPVPAIVTVLLAAVSTQHERSSGARHPALAHLKLLGIVVLLTGQALSAGGRVEDLASETHILRFQSLVTTPVVHNWLRGFGNWICGAAQIQGHARVILGTALRPAPARLLGALWQQGPGFTALLRGLEKH